MTKVALVTGASSGVGEALAPLLARHDWRVYGLARRSVELPGVVSLPADIADAEAVDRAVKELVAREGRLDALVHCAGIGGAGPVENMPPERARRIMEVNFWGSWHLLQACLPHLRRAPGGRILVVSSIAGYMGIPFRAAYCASKAALMTLSDSLRLELAGSRVQCCAVNPGDIATNSIATQYRQPAAEVADTYRERYRRADEGMAQNVDHGMSATHVATEMADLLKRRRLPPRYVIGEPVQKLSTVARRILPGRVWEWVLGRYYG